MSSKNENITSDKNQKVKSLLARREELFIFEGEKLVTDILKGGFRPGLLIMTEAGERTLQEKVPTETDIWKVADRVMKKISLLKSPVSVAAVFESLPGGGNVLTGRVVFVLDNIQDPGNMGSLFRCAAAFGISSIALTGECVKMTNPKFLRTAQNSVFHVPVNRYDSLSRLLKEAEEHPFNIYITSSHGGEKHVSPDQMELPAVVVIGNEGRGVAEPVLKKYPVVSLEQAPAVESLNAGVSGCILMNRLSERFKLLPLPAREL